MATRLTRDAVVDAALALLEAEGTSALSMRRVASRLGCAPMALYRHVRDKDELLVLVVDRLASEIPRPALPDDPAERLVALAQVVHDGLAPHRWAVDALGGGRAIAPSILWVIDEVLRTLMAAGFDPAEAVDAYRAIWQQVVGALAAAAPPDPASAVLRTLSEVDPAELPALASVTGEWVRARRRDPLQPGLRALVEGLLAQRVRVH